jgi:dTDP-4-dehydrorhamnose reductase
MRLLVLGKNGQVGWALQRALAPLGQVVALGREDADLADAAGLRRAVEDAGADLIVNAAAYTAVDKAESEPELADRINHRAVAELGAMAAARGALVVHYSTDYVFDGSGSAPYREDDATGPRSVYGATKLAGEQALVGSGARHVIFRTSWVHAGRGHNFIRTMLRLAGERDSLRVVADQMGAPTSAETIAEVTATAIRTGLADGVYHLVAGGETSWHGLAQFVIGEALALRAPLKARPESVVAISTADYPTPAVRPANSRLDTNKLRRSLGIALPDWRDGARRSARQLIEGAAA